MYSFSRFVRHLPGFEGKQDPEPGQEIQELAPFYLTARLWLKTAGDGSKNGDILFNYKQQPCLVSYMFGPRFSSRVTC